jgi:succinyl-CoA synthetase beta subunit
LQTTSETGLLLTTFATKFERADMNIHEYQGKSILKSFGVAIQNGRVADTPEAAHEAAVALAEETGTGWFVVKAQIHAGGRGKGSVTETGSHGVVLAKGLDQVKEKAAGILGGHLVTAQTSAEGKHVSKVLIAEDVYGPGDSEPSEIYMSVLLDRANGQNIIMYSPQGGMDIEAVGTSNSFQSGSCWEGFQGNDQVCQCFVQCLRGK